jgi:hypothetical protein
VTRGSVAKTPYFPKTICCLALIPGDSHDSGHDSGCDDNGKKTTIPNEFRESLARPSRIRIGADNGGFANGRVPSTILASRGVLCKTPPPAQVSRYLAGIPGESWDSGLGLGLDALAI